MAIVFFTTLWVLYFGALFVSFTDSKREGSLTRVEIQFPTIWGGDDNMGGRVLAFRQYSGSDIKRKTLVWLPRANQTVDVPRNISCTCFKENITVQDIVSRSSLCLINGSQNCEIEAIRFISDSRASRGEDAKSERLENLEGIEAKCPANEILLATCLILPVIAVVAIVGWFYYSRKPSLPDCPSGPKETSGKVKYQCSLSVIPEGEDTDQEYACQILDTNHYYGVTGTEEETEYATQIMWSSTRSG